MRAILSVLLLMLTACGAGVAPGPQAKPQPTPIGTPIGSPVSKTIGAAGGSLSSSDGKITLEVPAGALAQDATLSIQPISDELGGLGAYRFGPDGLQFAKPARLVLHYTHSTFPGSLPEASGVAFQNAQGQWVEAGPVSVDAAKQTLSAQMPHFSDWAFYQQWYLKPVQAEVKVGESLELTLYRRIPQEKCEPSSKDPLPLCMIPEPDTRYPASRWEVNNVPGGNPDTGMLTGSQAYNSTVTYHAPAKVPSPNPVTVKATLDLSKQGKGVLYLLASVKVLPKEAQWQGTITYHQEGSQPWKVDSGFEGSGEEKFRQDRTYTVVGVKEVNGPSTTLLLKESSSAEYTNKGHMEKKVYEICQAFGPVILRHHFIYDADERLSGSAERTLEARLYVDGDHYNLAFNNDNFDLSGERKVMDIYKNGCDQSTTDRSYTKPVRTSADTGQGIRVEGTLDPKNPTLLKSGYEFSGEGLTVPTKARVDWNISKGQ